MGGRHREGLGEGLSGAKIEEGVRGCAGRKDLCNDFLTPVWFGRSIGLRHREVERDWPSS